MILTPRLRSTMAETRRVEPMPPPRTRRLGKRAFAMAACSYVWVLLGVGQLRDVPINRPNILHLMWSPDVRGALWLAPVVLALATCWARRASAVGIVALFVPAAVWMFSYAQAWAAYKVDGGSAGYSDGWYQSAIFLGAMLIPTLAALFPPPPLVEVNVETMAAGR